MKYPYIGKSKSGNSGIVLFFRDSFGAQLRCKGSELRKDDIGVYFAFDDWDEDKFTNIATEYLAKTYGEVKSKEHAEFIVKLAEGYGLMNVTGLAVNFPCWFSFSNDELCFFHDEHFAKATVKKQIVIPLPPECEEKTYRYEGMGNKPKHFDCVCTKCGGRCCIGNCDEWPKVNDNVVLDDENGIVKLPADAQDYYIVEVNGMYKQCKFGELSKPKTPEQELAEKLIEKYKHLSKEEQAFSIARDIIQNAIDKYDIKKKPQ